MLMRMATTNMRGIFVRAFLNQYDLGDQDIASDHPEPGPVVRPRGSVLEEVRYLVFVARVPRNKELHRVRVADEQRRQEQELVHHVQMSHQNNPMQLEHRRARSGSTVSTIAKPLKTAPATKYGGKMVVCQPGMTDVAKSIDTTLWTLRTSGVEIAAKMR